VYENCSFEDGSRSAHFWFIEAAHGPLIVDESKAFTRFDLQSAILSAIEIFR